MRNEPFPLVTAIRSADLASATRLLRSGADPEERDPAGQTPLMIAAGLGRPQWAELLLTAGADVHAIEPRMGATALHKAAQSGSADVVGLLLDHGAFIDQQTPVLGNTPLMDAVLHKHEAVVALLLARGGRTTIENHWRQSALALATGDGLHAIADLIRERVTAGARSADSRALTEAIKAGDTDRVGDLIAAGAGVDERVPVVGDADDDYTPLGLAAREGQARIVGLLLELGADPRRVNGLMRGTPLHEAAYFGHEDVIRVLTDMTGKDGVPSVEIDAQGAYNGLTALHDAVWHGHTGSVRLLVGAGARLDLRTHAGLTPRELALLYGYAELARLLAAAEETAGSGHPATASPEERSPLPGDRAR
ncbi:ankyrin repeat domain-containing protein [Streptomyces parvulus]|uniref:Uncharacterized protein n=1 Tax=Streptomyces parvulus TaxID=146923 RepID=A0A369UVX4_9ACTN|nr:ankyrin repeat domain-containing protein [Streptomyces parvulus]RDD84617.1 hypothetical protein DVZ84_34240 [Streptomyces parvulus]